MFFFYSLCNSLAFISEIFFLANDLEWYWWSHLLFFIFQTIPIVAVFVMYFRLKKKKAQILAADDEPMYVDDDYYWRNGWYDNPNDPRVLVQTRGLWFLTVSVVRILPPIWEDLPEKSSQSACSL